MTRLFTRPVWLLGGVVTAVGAGIVLFVAVGSPQPGTIAPSSADWWSARCGPGRSPPAMAATNAVTLLCSVTLGITVFGERLPDLAGRPR
ncbi:MAG: hypothetical protein ACJ71Y_07105 [Blastococcus sp.]